MEFNRPFKLRGEVVDRIFNPKRASKGGTMFSNDYLVIKADEESGKDGVTRCDFYPIKIYSSNIVTNWLGMVQNGDIVECNVTIDCRKPDDWEPDRRKNKYMDIEEESPNLWPNIKLEVFNKTEEAITVIQAFGKEDKLDNNADLLANAFGGQNDATPPPIDENDLPF